MGKILVYLQANKLACNSIMGHQHKNSDYWDREKDSQHRRQHRLYFQTSSLSPCYSPTVWRSDELDLCTYLLFVSHLWDPELKRLKSFISDSKYPNCPTTAQEGDFIFIILDIKWAFLLLHRRSLYSKDVCYEKLTWKDRLE